MLIGIQSKDWQSHCSDGESEAQSSETACPATGLVSRRVEAPGSSGSDPTPPFSLVPLPQGGSFNTEPTYPQQAIAP